MDIREYINKVKESNNNYFTKIENARLKKLVNKLKEENKKIPKAKDLIKDYKKALEDKNIEITNLKYNIDYLNECLTRIPRIFRKIFIKNNNNLVLPYKMENHHV